MCIRFRQLVPLLDRALPADVSSVLGERFLGFAQHMLHLATGWRENVATGFQRLQDVRNALENLEKGKEWDLSRSGEEYKTLASNALDTIVRPLLRCVLWNGPICRSSGWCMTSWKP